MDIADSEVPLPLVSLSELPHCPCCRIGILRPGIVWFGEALPETALQQMNSWLAESARIDLMLVVGIHAGVFPAADYINEARNRGARIAVFNIDQDPEQLESLRPQD